MGSVYLPPGLWLAVRRIPPVACLLRMIWLAAGVDRIPFWPIRSFLTPYAAPILAMIWITSGFQKRPSPPMTRKDPSKQSAIVRIYTNAASTAIRLYLKGELTFDTLRDGQEDAGHELLAIMRLLKDRDLLAKTGAGELSADSNQHQPRETEEKGGRRKRGAAVGTRNGGMLTYVPGFWPS